jgi:hypothetical protein
VGQEIEAGTPGEQLRPVPGTVRLMTSEPVVMPASAAAGQSSLREVLEERPWLVAAALLAAVGIALIVGARRRS